MREANWDEIFQKRKADAPSLDEREQSVLPWEDWLTFSLMTVLFLSVVYSIDSANWVDDMPSLYPIGLSGLIVGYALSKVRWHEAWLHPIALVAGSALVYVQLIAIVPRGSLAGRTTELVDRMRAWWTAVTQGGISSDPLPFIVMVLALLWLGAYMSSWAVFRWKNAWLALVPGGTALMWNISFLPGQFSYAFVIFIFAALLLLMRVHLARKQDDWERADVKYPEFITLSALNATFWVAIGLLVLVWLMPLANRSDTANERWATFTAPVTERFAPLARVFISVNAKKPIAVHNLKDALALQGKITLNSNEAVEIDVEITPEMAAFLRGQSFDEYTSSGWKLNIEGDLELPPGQRSGVPPAEAEGARQEVTVNVTVKNNNDSTLYSVGQPLSSDRDTTARTGDDSADVSSLAPSGRLRQGDSYRITGSASIASVEQLQAAGTEYPDWVTDRYLQLPSSLPERVGRKALEVTGSAETPYEQAIAIERYLRTFPNDYDVESTPPGRDSVDYFLFDMQRGYFDYHASAMAVLLRSLGVPARVATGYVVDPLAKEDETNRYRLTERNAFAWPEVYFPGVGWVEFSPTPSQPLINRPGTTPLPIPPSGSRGLEDRPLGDEIDLGIDSPREAPVEDPLAAEPGGGSAWPPIITLAVIGGLMIAVVGGGRLAWEFGLGGLPRSSQLWEKTQRLARWGRVGGQPSDTPREFAARVRGAVPGTEGVDYLAAQYERSRFGHKELNEEDTERLESAWSAVRNQLLRRVLRLRPRGDDYDAS